MRQFFENTFWEYFISPFKWTKEEFPVSLIQDCQWRFRDIFMIFYSNDFCACSNFDGNFEPTDLLLLYLFSEPKNLTIHFNSICSICWNRSHSINYLHQNDLVTILNVEREIREKLIIYFTCPLKFLTIN